MSRVKSFIDWRFLFSLALLLLVAYLVYAGVSTARDNREKGARIDVLIAELQHQRADAEDERRAASSERARLFQGQQELQEQYEVLIRRQAALLAYLRAHGIDVPRRFVVTTRTVTVAPSSTTGHARTTRRSTSGSTAVAPTPSAKPHGKSAGKAKVHQRHSHRGH